MTKFVRKRKPETKVLAFRVTLEEEESIKAIAAKENIKVSELLRKIVSEKVGEMD